MLTGVIFGVTVFVLVAPAPGERAACDRAFGMLMEASNAVDLDRAEFLVRTARCNVLKRLTATID
jgi:hypothetical protein